MTHGLLVVGHFDQLGWKERESERVDTITSGEGNYSSSSVVVVGFSFSISR